MTIRRTFVFAVMAVLSAGFAVAGVDIAPIDRSSARNPSSLAIGFPRIGTLDPASAREGGGGPWMLDGSTQDRDFVDFDEYCQYLEPLGIRRLRLMAGWAKTERTPGAYDFSWLDRQVDWCRRRAIDVYMDISYGNPIYPGSGGIGLADGIPRSAEGLAAWDRWVEALALHYRDRISDWAIWNEPDNRMGVHGHTPADITALNVRTAKILKRIIPGCKVSGFPLCGLNDQVLAIYEGCLRELGDDARYFDFIAFHAYSYNPDFSYRFVDRLREICARYVPGVPIRQTESGCPSEWVPRFAVQKAPLSENSQAKWDMRRMLGDWGRGIPCSILHICDMNYVTDRYCVFNRKGLLRANVDHRIIQVKKAYYAVQNVVSVFDGTVVPVLSDRKFASDDQTVATFEFVKDASLPVLAYWERGPIDCKTGEICRDEIPCDGFETRPGYFEWKGRKLDDPVLVDLFSGAVYALPADSQICHSSGITFVRLPVYDSPFLLLPRSAVRLQGK